MGPSNTANPLCGRTKFFPLAHRPADPDADRLGLYASDLPHDTKTALTRKACSFLN